MRAIVVPVTQTVRHDASFGAAAQVVHIPFHHGVGLFQHTAVTIMGVVQPRYHHPGHPPFGRIGEIGVETHVFGSDGRYQPI